MTGKPGGNHPLSSFPSIRPRKGLITIGLTQFPNGVNLNPSSTVTKVVAFGTASVAAGTGNFSTGLAGVITGAVAAFQALNAGGGTTQGYCIAQPVGTTGGSVGIQVFDKAGVAGTATTAVSYIAWGTAYA